MDLVVETTTGRVEGLARPQSIRFAGIPFSAPRVGSDRFRAPTPPPGWSGIRDGSEPGPVAVQAPGSLETLAGGSALQWSEDCLTLNVQTRSLDSHARRPVMVWIHGGGFRSGSGAIPWYDGSRFVEGGDVVYVSINYRLGPFGWLALDHLSSDHAGSGNLGLLDQIAALKWVRDNITPFGGDPGNVTIFGESAGAMSVATLLGTPAAQGLFHRVIAQSGGAHNVRSAEQAADVTDRIIHALGGGGLDRLYDADPEQLLAVGQTVGDEVGRELAFQPGGGRLPFSPVEDGVLLNGQAFDQVASGLNADVPLLIGTNLHEWKLFGLMLSRVQERSTIERRLAYLPLDSNQLDELIDSYVEGAQGDLGEAWDALLTDWVFRMPALDLAGRQAAHQPRTYLYLFEYESTAFEGRLGSCHALEIPFVFDMLGRSGTELLTGPDAPAELARAMHEAWIAFARDGNPAGALRTSGWSPYERDHRATWCFGPPGRVEYDPQGRQRQAWAPLLSVD